MKIKKQKILSIIILTLVLILSTANVLAFRVAYRYNPISMIVSVIMKFLAIVLPITYIIIVLIYISKIKNKKNLKKERIKDLLIVVLAISLLLWFGSDKVLEIGKTIG